MRVSKLIGRKIKETPHDAELLSHQFLLRGAYIRQVASGVYSLLPIAKRVIDKIENIIREEMNKIEGQEVLLPVVLPRELWEESGRYETVGSELLRFKDRGNKDFMLAMTHEEAVVHLARTELSSYKQLPFMLYQIQTKFRDEPRSRGGLIRVREFTMKDAYSFHESQEDLEKYYKKAYVSYENIFKKAGLKNVLTVESDTGMMGGGKAHEFMLVSDCGEDTLIVCDSCGYSSNREVAESKLIDGNGSLDDELKKVHTPQKESIEDVTAFLGVEKNRAAKAVLYTKDDKELVFALIRGDFDVNESKLSRIVESNNLRAATNEEIEAFGIKPGYASPMNIPENKNLILVVDESIVSSSALITGANEKDYHYTGFDFSRDLNKGIISDIRSVKEGDKCKTCGSDISIKRGVEIGNIFQLGTKYTGSMKCSYLNRNGKAQTPIMGCYGIGVGRLMASVMEDSNDKFGPIWPITIAPWQIQICALNLKKEGVKDLAEKLYKEFTDAGLEVLYDDRDEKAGFQFSEADLAGIPFRITVSPKTVPENKVEFKIRGEREFNLIDADSACGFLKEKVSEAFAKFNTI